MLPVLPFILLVACSQAVEQGRLLSQEVCRTLSAQSDFHGDPLTVQPGVLEFSVTGGGDTGIDPFLIKLYLNEELLFMQGWAIQVREYGSAQLNRTWPLGAFSNPDDNSDLWLCPFEADNPQWVLNGVVHKNHLAQKQDISMEWNAVLGNNPQCARVVATIMNTNNGWWYAAESDCFLHVVDGVSMPCPEECNVKK